MTKRAAIDDAWQIHSAIVSWTTSVDSKASFALAIESAVMAGIVGLAGRGRLSTLHGAVELAFFWSGVTALTVALLAVAYVVRPRLRNRKIQGEVAENFIYFGHARRWNPKDLEQALTDRELLPVLSRQVVWMSEVAWLKHRLLQISMTAAVLGTTLVALAAWLNH